MSTQDGLRVLAGRYRIDGLLGRGGMSEVYHGYDERLDRRVAIKLLRPHSAPPEAPDSPEAAEILDALERDRKRFLREIRTTARLEHPGTPAVYDTGAEVGTDGAPQLWLVIQLLRGSTLESALDDADYDTAPPSPSWAAAIGAQVAAVLTDVHRVDVVHRDIKPANLMIVDGGLVKVLDFGIAILRGAGALPRLTQVDRTVGTPTYMSPEQHLGRAVTAASDVYSLGCLLHELLTGDPPFRATADESLRAHHLQSPPPSARDQRADVPDAVSALVVAMLAKDPSARPAAPEVYDRLLPFAAGSEPAGAQDRDPTRPFRRPLLAPPRHRARTAGADLLTEADVEQLRSQVGALLDSERPAAAIRLAEDGLDRAGGDRFLELQLRHLLAAALVVAGEYARAAPLFDAVGRDYRRRLGPTEPLVLECAYQAGHAYAEVGNAERALPQLRYYVQNAGPGRDVAESRFVIAQMLAAAGQPDEALAELEGLRPVLAATHGVRSTQVRNLDKQLARLRGARSP